MSTQSPPDRPAAELPAVWGSEVVADPDGPGRIYHPRPKSTVEMLHGTRRWAERTFLVQGERRVGFGEFLDDVPCAASELTRLGARPGDRVFVLAYNRPDLALMLWAAWWTGLVPVLGNRWWSDAEIRHALDVTEPTVALSDRTVPSGSRERPWVPITALTRRRESGHCPESPPVQPIDEHQPALILFTSGSSGTPKAVVLSHRSVVANQQNLLSRTGTLSRTTAGDPPQRVVLAVTPMFHVGGVSTLITQTIAGGKLVMTTGRFDAGEVLALIERERVASWGGVPTMAARLLEHPDFDRTDLSSLRSFPLGGAPVPAALLDRLRRKLPHLQRKGLANTWGMTESGGFVTAAGATDLASRPGTVGRPYPVAELRIADADETGRGEVLLRSPTVMLGYLGPGESAVDAEGWLHTGDLGRIDDDGYLFLAGRSKDVVIRGGENIACPHVEQALLDHPDVVEAAVFGVPHQDLGEELAAVVTHRAGACPAAAELRDFLRHRLAYFEVPSRWRIGDDPLPTLAGGKVDKHSLSAYFAEPGT